MFFPMLAQARTFISASNPLIRYNGRFDMRNPSQPRFDWPGVSIELKFRGTSCAVKVKGDSCYYNIELDERTTVLQFDSLEREYVLASGLKDTVHYLRISKRFERKSGFCTLKGFFLDSARTLEPLPSVSRLKIEFIGGSNLLGFGVETSKLRCDTPEVYSNADLSFGPVAARILNADYHLLGASGRGVVRNWAAPFVSGIRTMSYYYKNTLKNDTTAKWDFRAWKPDVVVFSCGVNDFSTRPYPSREMFQSYYMAFLNEIERRYPGVEIVCMSSSREPLYTYVNDIVSSERLNGRANLHFFSFKSLPARRCGCDWHPNAEAQREIGEELAEEIGKVIEARSQRSEATFTH